MQKLRKIWDKTLGYFDASHRRQMPSPQRNLYSRSLRIESLEERQMLAADVPHALFLPVGVNASDLGLTLGAGSSAVSAALTVVSESEPNNTFATANVVNLGFGAGQDDEVDVNGTIGGGDTIDFFRIELKAGDIFGAGVTGGGTSLTLLNGSGIELVGSSQDVTFIQPASSPLPGGNAALSWVVDTDATYYLGVDDGNGAYSLNLRLFQSVLVTGAVGGRQTLFLDFDGESIDTSIFGSTGIANLSPLSSFLANWGLSATDEDAVIDAIIASVEESLSADIRGLGGNGDFDVSGVGGDFDIEILNSRDDTDPFGANNVSRVIVGGSIAEFGIGTIGIAESIDVGNFDTTESGVVLLDLLSAVSTNPNSLNQFTLDPSVSIIDLIGVGVGNIIAHEAGHFFGNFHTDQFNAILNIMDQGGSLANSVGLVGGVWGDGDEGDVDFGDDIFVPNEGFTGVEDTLNTISFGLSTGKAPTITDVTLSGSSWAAGVEYAFSDLVANGDQLRPIATQNVNTIEIAFSENVLISPNGSELELRRTERLANGTSRNSTVASTNFSYDVGAHVATWTFGNLGDGKYSLELSDTVTDVGGNALDGEWSALDANTIDTYSDDPNSTFNVGNGIAGSLDYDVDGDEEFRLHFALLAGDYSGDGNVDGEDFLQAQLGGSSSDGNGDGIFGNDIAVWESNFGNLLPFLSDGGDFFDDEWVNSMDLAAWQQGFGSAFNGADFLTWQLTLNSKSVWFVESASLSVTSAFATAGLPPQVLNVIVSGSSSLHDPFSMDTVDGSGSQIATVPVGGADTISIVFSEDVNVDASSLLVIGLTTATLPQVAEFSYDTATNTATWRMEGWALGDQYALSLSDVITDLDGNNLDGEWTNPASITTVNSAVNTLAGSRPIRSPWRTSINTVNSAVSTFPSGDGLSGGRFNFVITLLPGDANLDGVVNSIDFGIFFDGWLGATSGDVFVGADFDGDGVVSMDDFYSLANNWGTNLQNVSILADLNGDFSIDSDDLNVISANIGMAGASLSDGDINGDGLVTLDDLDLAFAQIGLNLSIAS